MHARQGKELFLIARSAENFSLTGSEKAAESVVRAIARKRRASYIPGYWALVMAIVRSLPESTFQFLRFLRGRKPFKVLALWRAIRPTQAQLQSQEAAKHLL